MTDKEFIEITQKCPYMTLAAKISGLSFNTFKRKAVKLGIYKPNRSHKDQKLETRKDRIPTKEILEGKHPQYHTYKLKRRLIAEGYKKDECEQCGWSMKANEDDEFTPCELHHINGNPLDHRLENLIILCPNCHSLTKNYRFRRGRTNESLGKKFLDEKMSNSVKPDDTGNAEPSSKNGEGVET